VALDGHVVHHFGTRTTNRGLEVTVPVHRGNFHSLIVRRA
jgi:hypothetical protein